MGRGVPHILSTIVSKCYQLFFFLRGEQSLAQLAIEKPFIGFANVLRLCRIDDSLTDRNM